MLTLKMTFTPPCAGGGHITATAALSSGQTRTLALHRATMKAMPTDEELETFVSVLLRLYARQVAGTTLVAMSTAISNKTLDLTVTG